MIDPNHTDTSRSGDLVKRMRYTAKHGIFTAIKNGRYASLDEAADRIKALEAENEWLRVVLAPFAHYAQINDCDELNQDGVLEVPIRDLVKAATTRAALGER